MAPQAASLTIFFTSRWENGITEFIPLQMSYPRRTAVGLMHHIKAVGFDFRQHEDKGHGHFEYSFCALSNVNPYLRPHETPIISTDKPLDQQLTAIKGRFMYQMARSAWFILREETSLAAVRRIRHLVHEAHHMCIICGIDLRTEGLLYRSTTCSPTCSIRFRSAALEVRVPGLHQSLSPRAALWVVLEAAFYAGLCDHVPTPMPPEDLVKTLTYWVSILGAHTVWDDTALVVAAIKSNPVLELFVAWSSTHYRGCLIYTDPTWHDTGYSLFLFNGTPELELAHGENWLRGNKQSLLVFHGTTMDRLYPIMCDGLKFDSHLMQNTRAYGLGIYMTNDSKVALAYASNIIRDPRVPSEQVHINQKVLLVCELLQSDSFYKPTSLCSPPSKVYVVDKPDMLILRGSLYLDWGKYQPSTLVWYNGHSGSLELDLPRKL